MNCCEWQLDSHSIPCAIDLAESLASDFRKALRKSFLDNLSALTESCAQTTFLAEQIQEVMLHILSLLHPLVDERVDIVLDLINRHIELDALLLHERHIHLLARVSTLKVATNERVVLRDDANNHFRCGNAVRALCLQKLAHLLDTSVDIAFL